MQAKFVWNQSRTGGALYCDHIEMITKTRFTILGYSVTCPRHFFENGITLLLEILLGFTEDTLLSTNFYDENVDLHTFHILFERFQIKSLSTPYSTIFWRGQQT